MSARFSIQRATAPKKRRSLLTRIAVLIALLAVLLLAIGFHSFSVADELMRQPPRPLDQISSNIMPSYQLASFPSLDEQTSLSGWFFSAQGPAISTIILVHDQGENRLLFGLDSPRLYEHLTASGFNVLAFDLRNSGRSEGDIATFGYAEWADVIAAIRYVRQVASTRDVLLYGVGSGSAASLLALEQLPEPDQDRDDLPRALRELELDRSYVRGLLLDTPAVSPDRYIRPHCQRRGWLGRTILQHTVPYAVRLSAGSSGATNLVSILAKSQIPVFIAYSAIDEDIDRDWIEPLVAERQRLHPETTIVFESRVPGSVASFIYDQESYLSELDRYFRRYFREFD